MKPTRRPGEPIDWGRIRKRLARALEATEGAQRLSPARARAVLDERARALAHAPVEETAAASALEVVVFGLAEERYAIEARHVREVVRLIELTPLPGAPEFLPGVTNLRGQILAVIDLRKFFGAAPRGLSDLSRLVVLGAGRPEFGILADTVHEVAALVEAQILNPEAAVAGVGRDYLRGVTADGLIVLDGEALLQDPRLFVDQGEAGA